MPIDFTCSSSHFANVCMIDPTGPCLIFLKMIFCFLLLERTSMSTSTLRFQVLAISAFIQISKYRDYTCTSLSQPFADSAFSSVENWHLFLDFVPALSHSWKNFHAASFPACTLDINIKRNNCCSRSCYSCL